ncbi:Lrp/AsnC family transcriptional regulator [Tuanshanicoccus lijuaniae]|nr:Lrp/AsnC family transcriptional regulator [Aerococcaceae bacterium zg-1292]MBF6626014.1 Lrp/AsnC family transcriptional regulator [Aerococcaceae bacterium zg-BR9]MBF6978896.1 Lrp/AsnC family transcriptional regulator [Aerococcaceae bacterium zg-BR22]MBS4455330.1 Lrp/AsnC family transcriptional regulator [Aerococcaceae bacterium zg-A91]MBS4457290.1 Lrp/AsnC family transcriptional regulator [Aerococcaceae bacterium zg-BR33]
METREKILKLIEHDSRLTNKEIATLLGLEEALIAQTIKELEEEKIICGYHTLVNWDKTDDNMVSAIIELRVNPQRGKGFDRIAEKIYHFPEVKTMYLASGGFDFMLELHKAPIREIADFVSSRLSVIEEVQSTTTHVILKKYKEYDTLFIKKEDHRRMVVMP